MTKILILSDPNSPHTIKWVTSLANAGFNVYLCGLSGVSHKSFESYKNIIYSTLNININNKEVSLSTFSKLKYLRGIKQLKIIINKFKPDILHAHYASSYGFLAVLSKFQPLIISVWGSDVFEFPKVSFLHKALLKYILSKAKMIFSTSFVMARECSKYTLKEIIVTPFGIDINLFQPMEKRTEFSKDDFIIGTVKNLEKIYGIDTLINAFKILKDKYHELPLRLLIVGSGTYELDLKRLVKSLNLEKDTIFHGRIDNNVTPLYYNMMNVAVFLSRRESFGVSAIEAAACNIPVVVSNSSGFTEIFENEKTALIVIPDNPEKAAEAIEKILMNKTLSASLAFAGRQKVIENYNWHNNFNQIVLLYNRLTEKQKSI